MTPEERLERYARLAVEVGVERRRGPGGLADRRCPSMRRWRARSPASPTSAAPATSTSTTPTSTSAARGSSSPPRTRSAGRRPGCSRRSTTSPSEHGAMIQLVGDPEPELIADLDGTRVGKTRMRELAERYVNAMNKRLINWTIVAYPNEGWAKTRLRRARRRAALGRRRRRDPARRARSRSRPGAPHIDKLVARADAAERARASTASASAARAPT